MYRRAVRLILVAGVALLLYCWAAPRTPHREDQVARVPSQCVEALLRSASGRGGPLPAECTRFLREEEPVAAPADAPRSDRLGPCAVRRVIDGDTLDVRCGRGRERIRMLRIDTPEFEQRGYREASDALERYVRGAEVYLEPEVPGAPERDAYGRLLAYVWIDEIHVNVEMVRDGWSRFFTRHGEGRFAAEFARAEREARTARRGLWARAR